MSTRKLDPLQKMHIFWCVWGGEKWIREALAHALITKQVNDPVNPHFRYTIFVPIRPHGGYINDGFNAKDISFVFKEYQERHNIKIELLHYSFDQDYWIQHYLDFFRLEEMSKAEGPALYMDSDAYCINPINTAHPSFQQDDKIVFYHSSRQLYDYPSLSDLVNYFKCSPSEFVLPENEKYNPDFDIEVINFGVFFTRKGESAKQIYNAFRGEIDKINVFYNFKRPEPTYNEFLLTKLYRSGRLKKVSLDHSNMVRTHPYWNIPNGYLEIHGDPDNVGTIRDMNGYATIVHNLHHDWNGFSMRFHYHNDHTLQIDAQSGWERKDLVWV